MLQARENELEKKRVLFALRKRMLPQPGVAAMFKDLGPYSLASLTKILKMSQDAWSAGHPMGSMDIQRHLRDMEKLPKDSWCGIQRDNSLLQRRSEYLKDHPWDALRSHLDWMVKAESWPMGGRTAQRFVEESVTRLLNTGVPAQEIKSRTEEWLTVSRSSSRARDRVLSLVSAQGTDL